MSHLRRTAVLALSCALAAVTAGCAQTAERQTNASGTPTSAAAGAVTTPATPTTAGLSTAQLAAVFADYDRRNNPALLRANRFDPTGWADADTGPVLANDEFGTAVEKAARGTKDEFEDSKPFRHHPVASVGGTGDPDGLGPWLVATTKAGESGPGSDEQFLKVMTGGTGTSNWKMFASMQRDTLVSLPKNLPAGSSTRLDPATKQRLANTASDVVYALGNGNVDAFAQALSIQRLRTSGIRTSYPEALAGQISYQCWGWGDKSRTNAATATLVGTQALRSQRVAGGVVALLSLDCDWSITGAVTMDAPVAKVLHLRPGPSDSVRRPASVQLLLVLPDHGKPSIAGSDLGWQLPR